MKTNLFATAALIAILTATGAAHAETSDIAALEAQSAALKKQNAALEARLNELEKHAAKAKTLVEAPAGQPAATSFMAADLSGIKGPLPCAIPSLDGPLTFCGITLFGTIDAGLGYASNGLPLNSKLYVGDNNASKFAHGSYFGVSPNNLSPSTIGLKGAFEILPGWSAVFRASTNFNPQSGQLANAPGSIADNNGLNRNAYSNFGDGSRAGQAFNDQLYVGLASKDFGQLTFGRHLAPSAELGYNYDPAAASFAFSTVGYFGSIEGGLGNTENVRWDNSLRYRVEYPVNDLFKGRFTAMYKFVDGNGGCNYLGTGVAPAGTVQQCYASKNDAGQIDLGFTYGGFDFDGVLGYFNQSTSLGGPLSSAQLSGASTFTPNWYHAVSPVFGSPVTSTGANSNTLAANIFDTTGFALGAKYTWNQWKLFAGWAHEIFHNPADNVGIGAQIDQGGYVLSSVNNASLPHAKLLDTVWTGAKYAYNEKTDIVGAFYIEHQNAYGWAAGTPGAPTGSASTNLATCSLPAYISSNPNAKGAFNINNPATWGSQTQPRSSTCAGNLYGASAYVDYHFTKRFDIYAGFMYSVVEGGLASGYYNVNNFAPTVGARFAF